MRYVVLCAGELKAGHDVNMGRFFPVAHRPTLPLYGGWGRDCWGEGGGKLLRRGRRVKGSFGTLTFSSSAASITFSHRSAVMLNGNRMMAAVGQISSGHLESVGEEGWDSALHTIHASIRRPS